MKQAYLKAIVESGLAEHIGKVMFKYHDTHGLPFSVIEDAVIKTFDTHYKDTLNYLKETYGNNAYKDRGND